MSPYAVLGDGRIVVAHGTGETRLGVLNPETGRLTDLDLSYSVFIPRCPRPARPWPPSPAARRCR